MFPLTLTVRKRSKLLKNYSLKVKEAKERQNKRIRFTLMDEKRCNGLNLTCCQSPLTLVSLAAPTNFATSYFHLMLKKINSDAFRGLSGSLFVQNNRYSTADDQR